MINQYKVVTRAVAVSLQTLQEICDAVNGMLSGKMNVTGEVTLTASATSTVLKDPRISTQSVLLFMATTANAATAKAGIYITGRTAGQATINHASSANTDQTFSYLVIG